MTGHEAGPTTVEGDLEARALVAAVKGTGYEASAEATDPVEGPTPND